jgi:hypothetical protein
MVVCLQQKQNSYLKSVFEILAFVVTLLCLMAMLENFIKFMYSKMSLHKGFMILYINLSKVFHNHFNSFFKAWAKFVKAFLNHLELVGRYVVTVQASLGKDIVLYPEFDQNAKLIRL